MRTVFVLPGGTYLFDHSRQFSRMSLSTTMFINTKTTSSGTKGILGQSSCWAGGEGGGN